MVHDLITMKKMNKEAAKRPASKHTMEKVPAHLQGNASAIRNFINRPWTAEELSGGKVFKNREVL